jgi:hypothetical protein
MKKKIFKLHSARNLQKRLRVASASGMFCVPLDSVWFGHIFDKKLASLTSPVSVPGLLTDAALTDGNFDPWQF